MGDVDTTIEAPYWANNTGGKTLALLNLYPFEQYIHIETCQAEMSEGLCRPGCRCEQQYRLHRLLAFDPNNECRGIFSDWFSFPSFCLCKCYGAREVLKGTRDPKKSDFSPAVQASHRLGPGPTHNRDSEESFKVGAARESKDSKLSNHRLSHVPAVFPYEGRAALFAELQQYSDQEFEAAKMLGSSAPGHNSVDSLDTVETLWSLGSHGGHMDNTVESDQVHSQKKRKQGRGLEPDNFFYNQPIMDFALPDGTVWHPQADAEKIEIPPVRANVNVRVCSYLANSQSVSSDCFPWSTIFSHLPTPAKNRTLLFKGATCYIILLLSASQ